VQKQVTYVLVQLAIGLFLIAGTIMIVKPSAAASHSVAAAAAPTDTAVAETTATRQASAQATSTTLTKTPTSAAPSGTPTVKATSTTQVTPTTAAPTSTLTATAISITQTITQAATPVVPTKTPIPTVAVANRRVFQIDPNRSQARFLIDELLFGRPKTVVGVTNEVAGQIIIDLNNFAKTKISPIQINARTLRTDSGFRDAAVHRFMLQSGYDEYQFITFEPALIRGLPASISVGDTVLFKVIGNLKIRDVVNAVTFDVTVTVVSDRQFQGLAKAMILYEAFGLTIPRALGVADVAREVPLEFEFVAVAQ